jgi:hypothetical protein
MHGLERITSNQPVDVGSLHEINTSSIYLSACFICCLVDNAYRVTNASTAMPTQHPQIQHNRTQYQHIHRQPSTVGRASPHKAATGCCSTTMLQAPVNSRNRSATTTLTHLKP